MAQNYNGLTRNTWTGTWSPNGEFPVALSGELRGGLQSISGDSGDQLTDLSGQRLEEGMLVYVKNSYGSISGNAFYQYVLLGGESRNPSTGYVPNNPGNWILANLGSTQPAGTLRPWGYEHVQSTAALTWIVAHGQTTENVTIQVFDEFNKAIIPDEVEIIGPTTVEIRFTSAITGRAILTLMV